MICHSLGNSMNCVICKENIPAKYKCPKCRTPYCSVACCKAHKAECGSVTITSNVQTVIAPDTQNLYNFLTDDTVPLEKLQLLEQNQELKNILGNRHLRDMLVAIDKSSNSAASMQQAMLEPIFVEFADECLKVVQTKEESAS